MEMNGRIPLTIIGSLLIAGFSMGVTDCEGGGSTDAGTRPGDDGGTPTENCTNRADDDGDGRVDCFDSDCTSDPSCSSVVEVCTDRVDNDRDGATDCADSDCSGDPACPTATTEDCDNGVDDDGDGAVDCDDPECTRTLSCTGVSEICDNLTDDDGDGDIDCADSDCAGDAACTVRPCSATDTCIHSDAQIAEANRVCGRMAGCLGNGYFFADCVANYLRAPTAAEYRTMTTVTPQAGYYFNATWWRNAIWDPESRTCLSDASTCDDVSACLNEGDAPDPCPDLFPATCDGSTLRACMRRFGGEPGGRRIRVAVDCAEMGLGCFGGEGTGSGPACAPSLPRFDDETATMIPTCDGNFALNGAIGNYACPPETTCTVIGSGTETVAACVGTGATCDGSTFVNRCESDGQITQCVNGRLASSACAPNSTCRVSAGEAACSFDEVECIPEATVSCDRTGGRMTTCAAGHRGVIDCSALGFTSCGSPEEGPPVCL